MLNEDTIRIDVDEINSKINKDDTLNLDLNRHIDINKYDTIPNFELETNEEFIDFETVENFTIDTSKGIDHFEEIDNENNLSNLELPTKDDTRSQLDKKGYIRKETIPVKSKNPTVKRRTTNTGEKSSMKFYVMLIILAINICIVTFFIAFNVVFSENRPTQNNDVDTPLTTIPSTDIDSIVEDEKANYIVSTGVIENIAKSGSIQIYDLLEETTLNLKYVSGTILTDQYGKPLVIDEFSVGEIVDYSFPNDKTSIVELSISKDAFRETRLSNGVNDTIEKTLTFNGKTYNYLDRTTVVFDRGEYVPAEINEKDIVNIIGYGDTIYKIEVIKGHGDATFIKNNDIVNGVVEIDTTETIKMEELTSVKLSEGAHKIIVRGDNIDSYAIDILIEPNKVTEVSLLVVQQKQGLFVPTISPNDSQLRIDGDIIDTTKPILLDYGPHTIIVTKDNYNTFQSTITIEGQETRMNIILEPKILSSRLNITTSPEGANIYIDNVYVGVSPITHPLEYGTHNILIKHEGYIEVNYPIEINTANPNPLYFTLQKSADALVP